MTRVRSYAGPVATVAVFAILPLAVFLAENRNEIELGRGLVAVTLVLLGIGLLALAVAARLGGAPAAERTAVVYAAVTFVLFQFAGVADALESIGLPGDRPRYAWLAWGLLLALAVVLAYRLSRSRLVRSWVLVAGVLLTAVNLLHYASYSGATGAGVTRGQIAPFPAAARHAGKGGPDVWFFILDGYPRADSLRQMVGYDDGPFLDGLRRRGFDVARDSLSSYPVTLASIPTTLALDYILPVGRIPDRAAIDRAMKGDNVASASLRRLGYRYVHATDYEQYDCRHRDKPLPDELCIDPHGFRGLVGVPERTFLEATPLAPLLAEGKLKVISRPGLLTPDMVEREVEERRDRRPVFVYSHLVMPHAPFRYAHDCSLSKNLQGTVNETDSEGIPVGTVYPDQIRCANAAVLTTVDRILRRAPDSLIFVQSDHGAAFGRVSADQDTWPRAYLQRRYSNLSTAHLPEGCRREGAAPVTLVNTFRIALACLTGERIPRLPPRHFLYGYEDGDTPRPLPASRLHGALPPGG